MKRLLVILFGLLMLLPLVPARSEAAVDEPTLHAIGLLTEGYGYTQAKAEAFDFQLVQTETEWQIAFSPKEHPQWVYSASFSRKDGRFISGTTPFVVTNYAAYPGESAVRDILRSARNNSWFAHWDQSALVALHQALRDVGVEPVGTLNDMQSERIPSAAQAIMDFFASCYGDSADWSAALWQWCAEEIASYGLAPETEATASSGIYIYTVRDGDTGWACDVTEYSGEVPSELSQAFTHPNLSGWTNLCGAIWVPQATQATALDAYGLAAFGKGEERLLVMLHRATSTEAWRVIPVGEKALLRGRDLSITCDALNRRFEIEYPISDHACEYFRVRVNIDSQTDTCLCLLKDYRRIDRETGETVVINNTSTQLFRSKRWYHVTTSLIGAPVGEEMFATAMPSFLEYIDAEAFPKSAQACAAAVGYSLPEGYGVVSGVHLRQKTSSHSADLGMYQRGALVRVLDTLPGDPYPWYHVRIGQAEGYMSSVYVAYDDTEQEMEALAQYLPLPVAKTCKDVALKKGTGLFDETVMEMALGTKMHVLAVCGSWLHVMVPQGEIGWLMDVNGTDGFVRASDVIQAATPIQLDWME